MYQVGGGAVDADHAGSAGAGDRIRLQPGPVGDVDDRHLLAGEQVGGVHQVLVDSHGSDIMQIGLGDRGAVDLRLEHRADHGSSTAVLSMSRVAPTQAAVSSRAVPCSGAGPSSGSVSTR